MARLTLRSRKSSRQSQCVENAPVSRVSTNDDDQQNDRASVTNDDQSSGKALPTASRPLQRRRLSFATSLAKLKKPKKFDIDEDSLPSASRNTSVATASGEPLYLQLPAEIQLHVLGFLDSHDILTFRHTCRACYQLVSNNATTLAHKVLGSMTPEIHDGEDYNTPIPGNAPEQKFKSIGSLLLSLYRPPAPNPLLALLRHQSRVLSLLDTLLSFIQTRIYMLRLTAHLTETRFPAYRPGLVLRLYTPVTLICHLISTTATHILYHHLCSHRLSASPPTCTHCQTSLARLRENTLDKYPPTQLIPMYHVLKLMYMHLRSALQPPSSIGPIERRFRGWGYGPPPESDLAVFMIFGGSDMLRKVDEMRGSYSRRLETVRGFVEDRVGNTADGNMWVSEGMREVGLVERRRANWEERERGREDESGDVFQDLEELRFDHVTWAEIACVPQIDGFLVGKDGLLERKIRELGLVGEWWTNQEDSSPYPWLRRLLGRCLNDEKAENVA